MERNKQAVAVFNKLSDLYEQKYMDVTMYGNALSLFCSQIAKVNASILELACGPGNIARYIIERRPDFNYLGTDLSNNMVERAQINNPSGTFNILDSTNLSELDAEFHGIIVSFLLPYLSKELAIELIENSASKLKTGGILYISTMEGDYSNSKITKGSTGDELYMYYHDSSYLVKAIKSNGLELIHEERIPNGNDIDLIILAKKHS